VTIEIKRLTKVLVWEAAQEERLQNSSACHPRPLASAFRATTAVTGVVGPTAQGILLLLPLFLFLRLPFSLSFRSEAKESASALAQQRIVQHPTPPSAILRPKHPYAWLRPDQK
jgi:hypothetical protein